MILLFQAPAIKVHDPGKIEPDLLSTEVVVML